MDHLQPGHWRAYEGLEPEDLDLLELTRRLTLPRWTFPVFLLGAFGVAGGVVVLAGLALGVWQDLPVELGLPAALVVLVASTPVSLFTGRRVRAVLEVEDIAWVLVRREWSTGQPVLPSTIPWPESWEVIRHPAPPTESELRRMRVGERISKGRAMRWLPWAAVAAVPIGVVILFALPEPYQDFLYSLDLVLPVLIFVGPFLTWFALAAVTTCLEGRVRLLREYGNVSGRHLLPEDLAR